MVLPLSQFTRDVTILIFNPRCWGRHAQWQLWPNPRRCTNKQSLRAGNRMHMKHAKSFFVWISTYQNAVSTRMERFVLLGPYVLTRCVGFDCYPVHRQYLTHDSVDMSPALWVSVMSLYICTMNGLHSLHVFIHRCFGCSWFIFLVRMRGEHHHVCIGVHMVCTPMHTPGVYNHRRSTGVQIAVEIEGNLGIPVLRQLSAHSFVSLRSVSTPQCSHVSTLFQFCVELWQSGILMGMTCYVLLGSRGIRLITGIEHILVNSKNPARGKTLQAHEETVACPNMYHIAWSKEKESRHPHQESMQMCSVSYEEKHEVYFLSFAIGFQCVFSMSMTHA